MIDVTLGLDIVGSSGVAARLTGHGQYGETVESYSGGLNLVVRLQSQAQVNHAGIACHCQHR